MDRRTTIKWVLAASATWPLLRAGSARAYSAPTLRGYGSDPDLSRTYLPGELWPLTLTAAERRLATALSDLIIPADERSPSASAAGVVDFIDEWISAPYPHCRIDRGIVLAGFVWLDEESARRAGSDFLGLEPAMQAAICDEICDETRAAKSLREPAHFFARYRDLTAGGFYSTPVGRTDLNYIGNVALAKFEGPPLALLGSLGLE
jgi:hypothetical protein